MISTLSFTAEDATKTFCPGGLSIGLLKANIKELNSYLTKYGYPEIPKKLFTIGG